MKKANSEASDWMRAEYKREDLGTIVRGKYAKKISASSNVVVIDPFLSEVFPNEAAVNAALQGLVEVAQVSARLTHGPTRPARKRVA